jgi:hypothetical protein
MIWVVLFSSLMGMILCIVLQLLGIIVVDIKYEDR